jgi:hypothetical protein
MHEGQCWLASQPGAPEEIHYPKKTAIAAFALAGQFLSGLP